jgi:O-antigen/teichoic acid export membrane protein
VDHAPVRSARDCADQPPGALSALWQRGRQTLGQGPTLMLLTRQVVAAIVAFAMNVMSARVMAPAGRGTLALLLQITFLLSVIAMLGIERPYVARRQVPFATAITELELLLRPGFLFAAASLLVGVGLAASGHLELGIASALVSVYLFGNMYYQAIRTAFIASGAVKYFIISALVSQVGLFLLGIIFLVTDVRDPHIWFLAYAAVSFTSVVIAWLNRDGAVAGPLRSDPTLQVIRSQGLKLLPASLGNTAMLRSDRLLLPLLASTSELGIYVVVATVMEMGTWPVQQWVDASLRKWNLAISRTPSQGFILMAKAGAVVAALSLAFGVLAYETVIRVLPVAYHQSLVLIVPLGIASVFYAMTRVQQGLLVAQGHAGRVSAVEATGMIASVAMYVLLIPGHGAMGAALGSLIGYFACLVAGAVVFARSRPVHD